MTTATKTYNNVFELKEERNNYWNELKENSKIDYFLFESIDENKLVEEKRKLSIVLASMTKTEKELYTHSSKEKKCKQHFKDTKKMFKLGPNERDEN